MVALLATFGVVMCLALMMGAMAGLFEGTFHAPTAEANTSTPVGQIDAADKRAEQETNAAYLAAQEKAELADKDTAAADLRTREFLEQQRLDEEAMLIEQQERRYWSWTNEEPLDVDETLAAQLSWEAGT